MSSPVITPNMSLTEPAIGSTVSPIWAQYVNNNFSTLDSHDHSPGKGIPITPAGLDINSDLSLNGNNLIQVNSVVYNGAISGVPSLLATYTNGTDLFYKDANGNLVQITKNGSVNVSAGNIQGLPSTPDGLAGISWINAQSTFQLIADNGTSDANLDTATIVLRYPGSYPTPSGTYISIQAPSSGITPYAITLPPTAPSSTSVVQMGSSGALSTSNTVPSLTMPSIEFTNNTGVTFSSSGASVGTDPTTGTIVLTGNVFLNTTSNASLAAFERTVNVVNAAQTTTYPIVVSAQPNNFGLKIVRGVVQGTTGGIISGEGFTASRLGTGNYFITFTNQFSDNPAVLVSFAQGVSVAAGPIQISPSAITNLSFSVSISQNSSNIDVNFSFLAIAQRG